MYNKQDYKLKETALSINEQHTLFCVSISKVYKIFILCVNT
jgi:hypothetical protein